MSASTLYDLRAGVARITLNQPERRNALSDALVTELLAHLRTATADDAVHAIVLTGAGSAFCAGADLRSGGGTAVSAEDNPFVQVLHAIRDTPKPVIARVNGHAFGGGIGLVAAADLVLASDAATFAFSEVRIGVVPAMISVLCVPKLGAHQAMWLFLTGERFSADRAVELGLVHRAVPATELDTALDDLLDLLRLGGPVALGKAKALVHRIPGMPVDEAFRWTAGMIGELFASAEAAEGMTAFLEKRKPRWAEGS
ncbi:MAG: enoyl-CoA hydratase-related protein [Candidatus Binatia bacterium]